jgi:hypothetical protein
MPMDRARSLPLANKAAVVKADTVASVPSTVARDVSLAAMLKPNVANTLQSQGKNALSTSAVPNLGMSPR